jgi:hypothetical protein
MSLLTDAIANTALSKLKNHMREEGISCYLASIDESGEFTTTPIKGEFKIVPMKEYLEMRKLLTQTILHNGK